MSSSRRFAIAQTISVSETLSWIHGKHNLRFGGDYRRVHNDFLSSSNATGSFAFTGLFTQNAAGDQNTGSSFADFLLGLPQQTALNAAVNKSYLRDNVFDVFAMDDWRWLPSFTVNAGLRYEYFAPYTEKNGRLAEVATSPANGFATQSEVLAGQAGLPAGAGVSVSHGICAAGWNCVEAAEAEADGGARWLWDELHRWCVLPLLRRRWRTSRRLRTSRQTRRLMRTERRRQRALLRTRV